MTGSRSNARSPLVTKPNPCLTKHRRLCQTDRGRAGRRIAVDLATLGEGSMHTLLLLPFTRRFIVYTASIVSTVLLVVLTFFDPHLLPYLAIPIAACIGLAVLGTADLIQTRRAILRNYPISAHLRFLLESIRPEMRQYFFEDEKHAMPFSRDTRALVYQRAKMVLDKRPLGTQYHVYAPG